MGWIHRTLTSIRSSLQIWILFGEISCEIQSFQRCSASEGHQTTPFNACTNVEESSNVLAGYSGATAIGAEPVNVMNLGPNQPLALTLNLSPNNADTLLFFDNTPLSASGVPSITGQLFNNGNLLGTFTQLQTGYFEMAFESLTTQPTSPPGPAVGILPTQVDFSGLNKGTTTGCLFVTVTGGSISLNPAAFVAYDALISDSFTPLGGMSSQFYWSVPPQALSIDAMVNAAGLRL